MSRFLNRIEQPIDPAKGIFNAYVALEFDVAIQSEIFRRMPARPIRRRYSVAAPQCLNNESRSPSPANEQGARPVLRRNSVAGPPRAQSESRRYVCPDELQSAIENFRNHIGKFCFCLNWIISNMIENAFHLQLILLQKQPHQIDVRASSLLNTRLHFTLSRDEK